MKSSALPYLHVAVVVLMAGSRELLAQQAGPLFTERFANVFDPNSRTYFSLQGTEGNQFGGQQPFTSLGATHYLGTINDRITLLNSQLLVNNNGNPAGTLGAQQRWLTTFPGLDRSILGAGLYFDFNQSRYNNAFQQANVNLELYTESAWVARVNGYFPIGQIEKGTGLQSIAGASAGQLTVIGNTVGFGGINRQLMDVALMGSDFEFGRKFFNYRTEVYGGYYNWNGPLAGFTNGVKGGVRAYITNNLSGNVNISHDQFFGTNVYGGMTFYFGGSGGNRPMAFENLMTLPVNRAQQVSIGNFTRDVSTFHAAHDSITGDELHMYFVKEGGAGTGTQTNQSNVTSVLANSQFGTGSALVLMNANGDITTPIALTHDRQQIIGGGSTGTANVDFSLALGQAPGTSVVHLSDLGGAPVLAPTSGDAVTLMNQNTVQGFTIDGSGGLTNGIVGHPGAMDTIINGMTIQNVAGTGIKIQPSTNTTVNNVTFTNNGQDLLLNAANSKITNITSTGAKNGSLNLGGSGGNITGTTLISNVNISGAGGFGGILLNNAQNAATINLTNVTVNGGTGAGITVSNSQAGSIYNLTSVSILNVGGDGLLIQNSAGTVNGLNPLTITNVGGSGLMITNSSGLTSTIQSVTINQVGTASSDNGITLTDAGIVSILGGTIDNTLGDGIHSSDTNLTVTGLNIGGIGPINGDGIEIVNNGSLHTVNLSNNIITGAASGISTRDSGVAKELLLTLDGNTLQAVNGGNLALSIKGNGVNSTIITSMNGGTVIGNGTAGGVYFNRVTFDASGISLSGTQVNAGDWTIGGADPNRIKGDGLRFDAPTGDLKFGVLNIFNDSGTGRYIDTLTLGTSFNFSNTSGTIDTTNGAMTGP